jgi:hypothetical protein
MNGNQGELAGLLSLLGRKAKREKLGQIPSFSQES